MAAILECNAEQQNLMVALRRTKTGFASSSTGFAVGSSEKRRGREKGHPRMKKGQYRNWALSSTTTTVCDGSRLHCPKQNLRSTHSSSR